MKSSSAIKLVTPVLVVYIIGVFIPLLALLTPTTLARSILSVLHEPGFVKPTLLYSPVTIIHENHTKIIVLDFPLIGSLWLTLLVALIASISSFLLAYIVLVPAILYRPITRLSLLLALIGLLPYPFIEAYVVQRVFDPRIGLVNTLLRKLGVIIVVKGAMGVLIYQVLVFTPVAFVILLSYVYSLPREQLEAALQLGARGASLARLIYRAARPAIVASLSLVLVLSIDDVAGPLVFEQDPSARSLLAYRAYTYFLNSVYGGFSYTALGHAIVLLLLSVLIFAVSYRSIAETYRGITSGRERAGLLPRLDRAGALGLVIVVAFLGPSALLKILCIVYGFSSKWVASPLPSPGLHQFRLLLSSPDILRAVLNSFLYTTVSIILVLALLSPAAYAVARRLIRAGGLLDAAIMSTIAIPGIVLAYAYYQFFTSVVGPGSPLSPIGAPWLYLVLGYVVRRAPLYYKPLSALVSSLPLELEEAARNLGAGIARIYRSIVAPIIIRRGVGIAAFTSLSIASEVSLSITIGGLGGSSGANHPAPLTNLVASYISFSGLAYAGALALALTLLYALVIPVTIILVKLVSALHR